MKKLLALVVLALAASVAYVAISESGAGAQQRLIDHYKCYQARHAKGSPRFTTERVFLTDQFRDNVEVSVLKLNTHCSSATQDLNPRSPGPASSQFVRGLNCYAIRDMPREPRFQAQNIDVRDKLAASQKLTVSKVQSLCVVSYKDTRFNGTLEGDAFICYQAKTAKGQPRFQQRNISMRDQFDNKLVRVIRPVTYCAAAEKKIDARNDDFDNTSGNIPSRNLCVEVGNIIECRDHLSTVHSTLESNDPIISCKTDYSSSVWYHWGSGANQSISLDTGGTTYNTVVAVFTGDKGPPWHEVGCKQNPSLGEPLQFDATANTAYHILVGSSDGHGGKLKFHLRTKKDAPDACSITTTSANRLTSLSSVGDSDLVHRSTMNAFPAGSVCPIDVPTACAVSEHTVWFNYTVPTGQTQEIRFDASNSSYDTLVAVYDDSAFPVDCGIGSVIASPLLSGQTYHVMVGDVDPNREGGKLKLRWTLRGFVPAGSQAGVQPAAVPENSLTCYQVRQARHRPENQTIFDQFSLRQLDEEPWTLTIGGVDSICVPSTKVTCTRYIPPPLAPDGDTASLCYFPTPPTD